MPWPDGGQADRVPLMTTAGRQASARKPGAGPCGTLRHRTANLHGRLARGLLLSVVLSLIAVSVGSVGVAAAHSPTILTPLAGSAINNPTPTFSGVVGSEGEDETLTIFSGTSREGTKVEKTEPMEFPSQLWQFLPAALPDGTYTAVVEEEEGGTAQVTFTVDTTPPAVTLTFPGNGSSTSTGSQLLEGSAGTAPGDLPTVSVLLFAGSTIGTQAPLEALTVNESQGTWAGTFGGLSPGTYTARAQQSDTAGNIGASAPVTFTVNPSGGGSGIPPAASFKWFPALPRTGENVTLVSSSTDAFSPITSFAWALTSSGPFRVGKPVLTTSFSTPGAHVVQLRVTDGYGLSSVATQTIPVRSSPLILMQPFPIVRIAGSETSSGVRLSLLSAQAPAGARVTVSCRGHGCPAKSESRVALFSKRKAGAVIVEFRRFERRLRDGVVLEIRISKPGEIGKYTRFVVRRGRLPRRVDMCLGPAGGKPLVCPSS